MISIPDFSKIHKSFKSRRATCILAKTEELILIAYVAETRINLVRKSTFRALQLAGCQSVVW
jgi:hypothetical protein